MKTGIAELPLHYGSCPKWLFVRMKKLSGAIAKAIVLEFGTTEFLKRISDPFFFQAFACVVGFDWHSSGTTTTLCAALKEANLEEYGIAICGGKGNMARKTPEEIEEKIKYVDADPEKMKYFSRIAAKVDSSCVQDGFELYHHVFIFNEKGEWSVVQQGLNQATRYARRYHWFSPKDLVNEPHTAVCCDYKTKTLNLVASECEKTRKYITELAKEGKENIKKLVMHSSHWFDLRKYEKSFSALEKAYEQQPKTFEELLSIQGIGAKALRALALISKLIYGSELSWRDPVKYSFAHGGKDRVPYPVDKKLYDNSIRTLEEAIQLAKLGKREKLNALKALERLKI
ncbi:MAG TPA: DUF763 domain-containing protein [Nanoarchaeota archaeon]|nr:DUF763 domain-containing protein [Nanoarchaeota archaeon]